jgi:hypothetical protein
MKKIVLLTLLLLIGCTHKEDHEKIREQTRKDAVRIVKMEIENREHELKRTKLFKLRCENLAKKLGTTFLGTTSVEAYKTNDKTRLCKVKGIGDSLEGTLVMRKNMILRYGRN